MTEAVMQELVGKDGVKFSAPVFPKPQEGEAATPSPVEDGPSMEAPSGVVGFVDEAARAVVGGVRNGLQEVGETVQWAAEGVGNAVTRGHDVYYTGNDGFEWLTEEEVMKRDDVPAWQTRDLIGETLVLPEMPDTRTVAGSMGEGVAQFVTGFAVGGKPLKGLKTVTKSGTAIKAMVQGAVTDFIAFDAHEARFSDFLRDNLGLADPITEYLSADEDDSVLEGKLKNAVEGLGMGVATDALVRVFKAFKFARKVKVKDGPEAAAKVMAEEIGKAADEGQFNLFDEATDPNMTLDATAGPKKVVIVGGKADPDALDPRTGKPQPAAVTRSNAKKVEARVEPVPDIDVKAFQESIDYEMGMVRGGSIPDPNRQLVGRLFNFDKMDSDLSTLDYLNMASDAIPEGLLKDKTTFDAMRNDARKFLADSIDVSPEVIDASLANMAKGMQNQQGMVLAGKQLVQSLSREVENMAYRITQGNATDADFAKMVRLQSRAIEVSGNLKSIITGAAQTTSAGRIHTTDAVTGNQLARADITKELLESVDKAGGRDAIRKLADDIMKSKAAGHGVGGTMRISAQRGPKGFWGVANEVRINGMLSGPKTHMINMISNGMQTVLLPGEKILGGAMGLDPARMREGAIQYKGIALALNDALKAAKMAAYKGRNILDPEASLLEQAGADYHAIKSTSKNPMIRGVVNTLGTAIRLPSRGLMAGDEFFKQINYRSDLYARLNTHVADLIDSGKVSQADAAKWVADRMETGFGKDGVATSKNSLDFAREATFTNDLRKGSLPKKIQDATNAHPALKLILPFVRTPTNLIVAGVQRTPILHMTSKNMMADLRSLDPSRVASARGKLATGTMLWGGAIYSAQSGYITGSGPVDYVQKARLMETGWRPYSVKVGDKYISYERLDPFAMFFGIAADYADIAGQVGEAESNKIAMAGFAAVANNVASKTWLRGITDAVDAFANPEMRAESYLKSMTTTFVPFSSALREGRKATDGTMRDTKGDPNAGFFEMQSIMNAVKNTVPGYSQTLPPKRSWVTGEPISYPKGWGQDMVTPLGEAFASMNPIYEGTWKKDPVLDELAKLEYAFTPPTRKIMGVEMTPEQYAVLTELHGKIRAPGTRRTMYQELERLFQNKGYVAEGQTEGFYSEQRNDPRVKAVKRVTDVYRKLAQQELLQRFPELKGQIGDLRLNVKQKHRSALSGVADLGG